MYQEREFVIAAEPGLPFTVFTNNRVEWPAHWHTYLELLFVIRGSACISVSGFPFNILPDDLLLINTGEVHDVRPLLPGPATLLVVQFEPYLIHSDLTHFFETKYFLPFLQQKTHLQRQLNLCGHADIKDLLVEILTEYQTKGQGYELAIKGDIYKIFAALIRKNVLQYPDLLLLRQVENSYRHIKEVLAYLENNYAAPLRIEDMAEMAHLSYHHFCRTFRKATGKTFLEYLTFVRIGEAEKMLAAGEATITEIAYRSGFSSVSYFSKAFKKMKGNCPRHYQHNLTRNRHK